MEMATVQQAAVALSAIIVTLTFIYKVFDDRRSRREKETLDWQKTVVHQIFQKDKSEWISFENIISKYRGEAADVPGQNIPREVLTSAALRKILIAMVSERIVDQKGGDQYQLLTHNQNDVMDARMKENASIVGELMSSIAQQQIVTMSDISEHRANNSVEQSRELSKQFMSEMLEALNPLMQQAIKDKEKLESIAERTKPI